MKSFIQLIIITASSQFLSCDGPARNKNDEGSTTLTHTTDLSIADRFTSVYQDRSGDYWFGSRRDGLYHYDGLQLAHYTTKDGLVHNSIRAVQEDADGAIYVETSNGISKYKDKSFSTLQPMDSQDNNWRLDPSDLWFGYDAKDVYRYDGDTLHRLKLPRKDLKKAFGIEVEDDPSDIINYPYAVYGVDKDKNGHIWIGTYTAGAYRYDGNTFIWFDEKELSALPDGRVTGVRSMIQDREGYFWLSNFYHKYKMNSAEKKGYEKHMATDVIDKQESEDLFLYFNSGLADAHGDLWVTTFTDGVWKYNGKTLSRIAINASSHDLKVTSIHQDNLGQLWIGTMEQGLFKYSGAQFEKFELD